ncbi:multidrug effflux MFS transporter [Aquibium sp. ELW1220]|uniref:multidrug effflux MFS transporter n=1 Tax=Aquibium sp. ELW1220 TaxID=2976766 RepID=UPI0025B1EE30|nr:multidrug effflux MFS transporter [Aquibium sp. ELW1220]MDN2582389.1 multidrug effflux MFS transporter [Aquibium sp. ELW1220]
MTTPQNAAGASARPRSPHILTLVIATASSALAMNVFLPSLPSIARDLNTDYAVVQLMVSIYLFATAGLQLVIGPASDRLGRRPVLLGCLAIFVVSSLLAVFVQTIEMLLVLRFFQAFAAGGMVISRAVVRDTVDSDEAASRIGYITMGMALVPMVAPAFGGILDEYYGWRATFVLTLVYGVVAILVVWFDLNETNKTPTRSLGAQFRVYPELIASRRFWSYTLTAAFTAGAFFAFLGGGPYVASEMLGIGPSAYGFYFVLVSIGYMAGNFLTGRFSTRVGRNKLMITGNVAATIGGILGVALFALGFDHPVSLFLPTGLVGIGNGMSLPTAYAGIVSVRPKLAGSASGLGGAIQMGGGAVLSILAGSMLSLESGPYPLFAVMIASSVLAICATLYGMHVDRVAGPLGDSDHPTAG